MLRKMNWGLPLAALFTALLSSSAASAGTLYAIDDIDNSLVTIDPVTYAVTSIGSTGVSGGDFGDLAYDSISGTLYWAAGRGNDSLYTLNLATGAATLVGSYGIDDLFALAYNNSDGQLYAQATSGNVYRLNPTTAAPTLVGSNGVYPGGMEYRTDTGQLILVGAGNGSFYTVDTTTGAATLLASQGFINDNDVAYDPDLNAYFVNDWSSNLFKFDGTTYAGGVVATLPEAYDGIVYVSRTQAVPEPGSLTLFGFGAMAFIGVVRRRRQAV